MQERGMATSTAWVRTYSVTRVSDFSEVMPVANRLGKCIGSHGANHPNAQKSWDIFGETELAYLLVRRRGESEDIGYIRMLKVGADTWVVDYVCPSSFEIVVLAAEQLEGTVLAKQYTAGDSGMVDACPRIMVGFPRLDRFPYRIQRPEESTYIVVIPVLTKILGVAPSVLDMAEASVD